MRVLYQIWDRPIYTIGGRHVITDALSCAAPPTSSPTLSTAAPAVTREAAVLRDPELILVSAPPASADDWLAEWRKFPGAVRGAQRALVLAYADERIDRMGPSVIEATASLCEVIDRARFALDAH